MGNEHRLLLRRTGRIALGLIILGPWLIATEPTRSPYYQYSVHGRITRDSGGDLSNHIVMLYGKSHLSSGDFRPLQNYPDDRQQYPDVLGTTDSTGRFHLRKSSRDSLDSLAIAVVAPDRPMVLGPHFTVEGADVENDFGWITSMDDGSCSCVTSSERSIIIEGYIYDLDEVPPIRLPY